MMDAKFDWSDFEGKLRQIVEPNVRAAYIAGLKEALEMALKGGTARAVAAAITARISQIERE